MDLEQVDRWIADNGLNSTNVLEMMREHVEAKPAPGFHTQPWDLEGREDYRAPTVSYAEQDVETKTSLDEISPRLQAIKQGIHAFHGSLYDWEILSTSLTKLPFPKQFFGNTSNWFKFFYKKISFQLLFE